VQRSPLTRDHSPRNARGEMRLEYVDGESQTSIEESIGRSIAANNRETRKEAAAECGLGATCAHADALLSQPTSQLVIRRPQLITRASNIYGRGKVRLYARAHCNLSCFVAGGGSRRRPAFSISREETESDATEKHLACGRKNL